MSGPLARIALVTRLPRLAGRFPGSFFEVKDVSGLMQPSLPGTVPMLSFFGDNRLASAHPEWVQRNAAGMRAVRSETYFDWDSLCPTRPEVQEAVIEGLRAALVPGILGIRLDDVDFAREGFCRCDACAASFAAARATDPAIDWIAWRADLISDVTRRSVALVRAWQPQLPIYFTLYPDPSPRHQLERFGVDLQAITPLVDAFVVPLYDLAYTTTYWLESLAWDFRDVLRAPLLLELYALHVDEKVLHHVLDVAGRYADGLLLAYEEREERAERLLQYAAGALTAGTGGERT